MLSDPSLPIEVAGDVLFHVVRFHTLPVARGASSSIIPALNVLPRHLIPDLTRVVLVKLWWYSVDDIPACSTSWLLPLLLDLELRQGRALMYTVSGFGQAARRGDLATMDAWIDAGLFNNLAVDKRSGEQCAMDQISLWRARHDGARGEHMLQVNEWWVQRGLPWGGWEAIQTDLELASSSLAVDQGTCISALEWWRTTACAIQLAPAKALVEASRCGYDQVLDWWWDHYASSIQCTTEMVDAAVQNGHLHVLKWWVKRFPVDTKCAKTCAAPILNNVADLASKQGRVDILKWWFDLVSDLPQMYHSYTEAAVDHAAALGHTAVLDFWLSCSRHADLHQRMPLKFTRAIDWACAAGRLDVLDWFTLHVGSCVHGNPCPLLDWPEQQARSVTVDCLNWRLQRGYATQFSATAMAMLSAGGRMDVLEWILSNRAQVLYEYNHEPLVRASQLGHIDVLDWWLRELSQDTLANEVATHASAILQSPMPVLAWWHKRQISWQPNDWIPRDCEQVGWAIETNFLDVSSAVQRFVDSCTASGDYESMAWCLRVYPDQSRDVLDPARLQGRLDQVQFGLIEFLTMQDLPLFSQGKPLDEDTLSRLAASAPDFPLAAFQWIYSRRVYLGDGRCTQELSRLFASESSLPLVEWIHKTSYRDYDNQLHLFHLMPDDLAAAQARGDLGLCRWVKRWDVVVDDFATNDM